MKKFHFRLEKLLTIRKHAEELKEIELGKKVSVCLALENKISDRKRMRKEAFFSNVPGSLDYEMLKGNYIFRLEKEIDNFSSKLKKAETEKAKALNEFLEASKQRKILDKLKERKESEYYKLQLLEEVMMSDDTAAASAGRKENDGPLQ